MLQVYQWASGSTGAWYGVAGPPESDLGLVVFGGEATQQVLSVLRTTSFLCTVL